MPQSTVFKWSTAAIVTCSLILLNAPTSISASVDETRQLIHKASYDKYIDYSNDISSTYDSFFCNNFDLVNKREIIQIVAKIEKQYNTKIINTWMPAFGELNKSCLFVSLESQKKLENENFELELYRFLKDDLANTQTISMVALA